MPFMLLSKITANNGICNVYCDESGENKIYNLTKLAFPNKVDKINQSFKYNTSINFSIGNYIVEKVKLEHEEGIEANGYIFKERERLGLLSKNGVMYNTIVTSSLGDKIATSYGVKTESFLTGFKYIGDRIQYYEENRGPDFEFGYEESYGCLISPFVRDKDGIQAILLYTEMTLFYKLKGLTLDEQYDRLEQRFGYHTTITHSITFKGSKGHNDMINLIDYIRRNPVENLCNHKVVKYNDYLNQVSYTDNKVDKINLESSNVLKFIFDDGSSIAIRPSGTEPKCKIYVEAVSTSREKADMYEKTLFRDFTLKYNINLNE